MSKLPAAIVDCHHHFLAPDEPFHATLKALGAPAYTAEQYAADCGDTYAKITKTVHVEAIADDGEGEAKFVEALASAGKCKVAAIVAKCDLAAEDASARLDAIVAASGRVRGIRKILDYDGPFDGACPTHVDCKAHDTDYLRDPAAADALVDLGFFCAILEEIQGRWKVFWRRLGDLLEAFGTVVGTLGAVLGAFCERLAAFC